MSRPKSWPELDRARRYEHRFVSDDGRTWLSLAELRREQRKAGTREKEEGWQAPERRPRRLSRTDSPRSWRER
jgi:hypothetical protein